MKHAVTSSSHFSYPDPLMVPVSWKRGLWVAVVLGVVTGIVGLQHDPQRIWASFLMHHFYFMSLALGGMVFTAIQWVSGAVWSVSIRRLSEAMAHYLPIVLLMMIVLSFGLSSLYLWTHADHAHGDEVLSGKLSYLNIPFFLLRNFVVLLLLNIFSYRLTRNSVLQDQACDPKLIIKNRILAPIFLIIFAVGYTCMSFDQLMSLDPHWFSTIFGIYCFAGLFCSSLAFLTLMTLALKKPLQAFVNENHWHDLGKLMFAFSIFWAYIAFSQFMLIWYANLPEETGYYIHRFQGQWFYFSMILGIGKFFIPFFILLPRHSKRSATTLTFVAIWLLLFQWVDLMWLIQPQFFPEGPRVSWPELGLGIGFLGLFILSLLRFLSQHRILAVGDSRLVISINHHQ